MQRNLDEMLAALRQGLDHAGCDDGVRKTVERIRELAESTLAQVQAALDDRYT